MFGLKLRHPLSLLLITVLMLLGALRSFNTPSPVGADTPNVVFSALRAEAILRDLLRESQPHVSGSPANARVRDRVLAHLQAAGYEPEVQALFHCNPSFGACSPVENIVAVKAGTVGRNAVLLTAHYDSSWAGPGAADDGAGTAAVLEIARMAREFPPWKNDVVFLLSDSEENGLIGADAFATHHPLFSKVGVVINLEARGVEGPSALFETGEGNRTLIRVFANHVPRPVGTSLVYELYRRMPNDTDYTVYRNRGVMGANFAFARGVALYHSELDDPDHLNLGSLQHHGDNAWGMLQALAERDLTHIVKTEDAGYIDLFGLWLVHYPEEIAGGLALFLGVWVMLAIGLAFRKEFRYRQLRWGLLAIPLLLLAMVAGGWLLSWPLGHWPDLHPLEHPMPWFGRLSLWLMVALLGYLALKFVSGRVSPCAWMIIGWALVAVLGLVLSARLPTAAHIALLPLTAFGLGSVIDLLRKKSPAPLLVASVAGFAMAAYLSLYHFLLLDVALNFDRSAAMVVPLWLMVLVAMPMLLACVKNRELGWRPAQWLGAALLLAVVVHLALPAYTAGRPRDMAFLYRGVDGAGQAYLALESATGRPDPEFADDYGFEPTELNDGRMGREVLPAREVRPLDLPGITVQPSPAVRDGDGWRRELRIEPAEALRYLQLTVPPEAGLQKAWVNGVLALDVSIERKQPRRWFGLRLVYPGPAPLDVRLQTASGEALPLAAVTRHNLPGVLTGPFKGYWPDEARPAFRGTRAELVQEFTLPAAD